jgi:hypothetical protein
MTLSRWKPSSVGESGSPASWDGEPWSKRYPTLLEFLCVVKWEDGSVRQSGTVTLMAEDGLFKAAMNDRDAGVSCFVSGKSPGSLLEAMEKGLVTGSLEWRRKTPFKPKGGRSG